MVNSKWRLLPIFLILTLAWVSGTRISSDGLRLAQNFHVVDPGKLYRSAQLSQKELKEIIDKYKIKTVINLRGPSPGHSWYDDEISAVSEKHIVHIDVPMTKDSIPKREVLVDLLDTFEKAPRPILIHCQSGSDRTSLASAIYEMEYMNFSHDEAKKMISPRYLHLSLFAPAMLYFFDIYKDARWAKKDYTHCNENLNYSDRSDCWKYCSSASGYFAHALFDKNLPDMPVSFH
jgi:protein tyrosine phosphatase (PTP) superfamily phosphohydrolase (DUF442 family)